MKWRLPILSLYVAIITLLSVGFANVHPNTYENSPIAHFEGSCRHSAKLYKADNYFRDNTEDENDYSFIGAPLIYSFSVLQPTFFAEANQFPTLKNGIAVAKRFILFRAILI